jgi:hypothetical protein
MDSHIMFPPKVITTGLHPTIALVAVVSRYAGAWFGLFIAGTV